jgi:aspartate/glutamate racemase/serine/threonine protein phosphatase PrpC
MALIDHIDAGVLERCEQEACALLSAGEQTVPQPVLQTVRFLAERGVWFRLSRNPEAHSCRDAARKRWRLGHRGIPLRDEMKSFFGRFAGGDGDRPRYVMAHCRGDRELDLEALARAVEAGDLPQRLTHEELSAFGLEYGLVNPFEHWQPYALDGRFLHAPVLQVFDDDLLRPLGTPGTVMTNAGDLTWAVELDGRQLFDALRLQDAAAVVVPVRAEIAAPVSASAPRPPHLDGRRSIAIVTGNGPESGIALWEGINGRVRELLGDDNTGDASMPPVRVVSLPELGMTMELDRRAEAVWERLRPVVEELCATDTALLAIACNTTQYFVEQIRAICEPAGVAFVSLPEVVAAALHERRVEEVAIVGIPYVADLAAGWSAYAAPLRDLTVEEPDAATLEQLVELAYRVKEEGPTHGGLNKLRSILNRGLHSSHVVLALTELSVLLALQRRAGRSGKTIVDPVSLYAEALARRWLGLAFPPPPSAWSVQLTGLTHHGRRVGRDDPAVARNEDAVLLADELITTGPADAADARPSVHQRTCSLEPDGDSLVAAVADGIGSHMAAAHASQMVLGRLRDAGKRLRGPDRVSSVLLDAGAALDAEAKRAGDPAGKQRGATVAGIVLAVGANGDLDAVWFSAGDCLLLTLQRDAVQGGRLELLCRPAVSPDGHPQRAIGAGATAFPDIDPITLRDDALFICCTDGFAHSFGVDPARPGLAESLSRHEALRDVWRQLADDAGGPAGDRLAAQALFAAAEVAWSPEPGTQPADNLSFVVVRTRRGVGAAGNDQT